MMTLWLLIMGPIFAGALGTIIYSAKRKAQHDSDILLLEMRVLRCIRSIGGEGTV